jgi:lipoprotein-anchoring transpeptidase ErfK/SrfK
MLLAAKWVISAALVTPAVCALLATSPVAAGIDDLPVITASPSSDSPTASSPSPAPAQTSASPSVSPTVSPTLAMEAKLLELGLPTGVVDGVISPGTLRGACAFRDLTGQRATRQAPTATLMARIAQTTALPRLPRKLRDVKALVSLTCQTTYVTDEKRRVIRVLPVSTGKDNGPHETRTGFKRVYYKLDRWQRSTLFPEPDGRPGLYRPVYFDRGIAFHGVRRDVRTYPQSHGCVRTWPVDQDWLFDQLQMRDKVFVYGNYWRGTSASLGGHGA